MASRAMVWLNGALLPVAEARISPFDRGFLLGDGVFETLACRAGRVFAVRRHWERLRASCETMGLEAPEEEVFREALDAVASANEMPDARLRFTVTRGEAPGAEISAHGATMLASSSPLTPWPALERLRTAPWTRNEMDALASVKSLSYAGNLRALAFAKSHGAGEAVLANTRGELCEGTGSNLFLVKAGRVMTPPLSSGCLAGVTRALVIEICHENGIPVAESALPAAALGDCDEIFITSATRDVQAVGQVDERALPGAPGAITRRVAGLFRDLVAAEADP